MTEWFVSQPGGTSQSDIAQSLLTLAVNTAEESPDQVLFYWLTALFLDQANDDLNELQQVD